MKRILIVVLALGMAISSVAWGRPAPAAKPVRVFADIPIYRAGDYAEFEHVMRQMREEVRQELLSEFGSAIAPLAGSTDDVAGLAAIIGQLILKFDGLYRQHREEAHDRIAMSLEADLKARFDELFRALQLPERLKRVVFVGRANKTALVDMVAYGTYSVSRGGRAMVTITLEQLRDGTTRSFSATAPISEVMQNVAEQILHFFQSAQYPEWINAQPHLTWIPQPAPAEKTTANIARAACAGQGARLPYARELIQSSLATEYRKGGTFRMAEGDTFAVADRQREETPYFYTAGPRAASMTGGPVHSNAGYGTVLAYFWCVKGKPSAEINAYESIYRLIRKVQGRSELQRVHEALEFILVRLDDFGARDWHANDFTAVDDAVEYLRSQGYFVELPQLQ